MLKNQITSYPESDVAANLVYILGGGGEKHLMSVKASTTFSESVIAYLSTKLCMHKQKKKKLNMFVPEKPKKRKV